MLYGLFVSPAQSFLEPDSDHTFRKENFHSLEDKLLGAVCCVPVQAAGDPRGSIMLVHAADTTACLPCNNSQLLPFQHTPCLV